MAFFHAVWVQHKDISQPETLESVLKEHFTDDETNEILLAVQSKKVKDALTENTNRAIKLGAYGAPYLYVRKWTDREEAEGFFGSDRFHYIYEFLGLPIQRLQLLPPAKIKANI
jgi:glutathione S-transferase kappa 1